jgi:pimeloyl-ACP methyl ester carboxylesterase
MTAADRLERAKSPVVFLHALGGSASQWRAQIEHLEPSRLAVAVDLPGHGVSAPAEDGEYSPEAIAAEVGSVLDALGLRPVVLVGHSYGSLVAIALAAGRSADVAGILLVEALAPETYRNAIAAHYEGVLTNARPEVREAVLGALSGTPREVVFGALSSLPSFDAVTPLEAFSGPKLSVIAEQHAGPSALHEVVEDMPVRSIAGVSHWLHMDRPEEFNEILDAFLLEADACRILSP